MPFKGEFPSLSKYTQEEISKFVGVSKNCPRCKVDKDVLSGFGLRRPFDKKLGRSYVMPRVHCRECDGVESRQRRSLGKWPSKTRVKMREKWRRDYGNPDFRKKFLARGKARYHFKKRMPCEVSGCDKVGQRHHENYDAPLDIRWLCSRHHAELHGRKV